MGARCSIRASWGSQGTATPCSHPGARGKMGRLSAPPSKDASALAPHGPSLSPNAGHVWAKHERTWECWRDPARPSLPRRSLLPQSPLRARGCPVLSSVACRAELPLLPPVGPAPGWALLTSGPALCDALALPGSWRRFDPNDVANLRLTGGSHWKEPRFGIILDHLRIGFQGTAKYTIRNNTCVSFSAPLPSLLGCFVRIRAMSSAAKKEYSRAVPRLCVLACCGMLGCVSLLCACCALFCISSRQGPQRVLASPGGFLCHASPAYIFWPLVALCPAIHAHGMRVLAPGPAGSIATTTRAGGHGRPLVWVSLRAPSNGGTLAKQWRYGGRSMPGCRLYQETCPLRPP